MPYVLVALRETGAVTGRHVACRHGVNHSSVGGVWGGVWRHGEVTVTSNNEYQHGQEGHKRRQRRQKPAVAGGKKETLTNVPPPNHLFNRGTRVQRG